MSENIINDPFWDNPNKVPKPKAPNTKLKLIMTYNNNVTEVDRNKTRGELIEEMEKLIKEFHVLNKSNFKIVKI